MAKLHAIRTNTGSSYKWQCVVCGKVFKRKPEKPTCKGKGPK